MPQSRLKVYYGPEASRFPRTELKIEENQVRVPLKEIMGLLADAVNSNRTWLRDFENEEIAISSDLYEVMLAYQYCRRPSA